MSPLEQEVPQIATSWFSEKLCRKTATKQLQNLEKKLHWLVQIVIHVVLLAESVQAEHASGETLRVYQTGFWKLDLFCAERIGSRVAVDSIEQ